MIAIDRPLQEQRTSQERDFFKAARKQTVNIAAQLCPGGWLYYCREAPVEEEKCGGCTKSAQVAASEAKHLLNSLA